MWDYNPTQHRLHSISSRLIHTYTCVQVPYSSRLMYVHSFQSLVWNRVATHRIRLHGLRPIPGDLVLGNGNGPLTVTEETLSRYTTHDVLLPLPGHDVTLPANDSEKFQ